MPFDSRHDLAVAEGTPSRRFYAGANLDRALSIGDLRARAHRLMPRFVLEYLEAGAGEEAALAREREAFADWRFLPRTLSGPLLPDITCTVLGRPAPLPLIVAPTGLNGLFMHGADRALAEAAASAGVPFIQSTMSNQPMEEVGAVPGLRHWWQLYVFGGDEIWQELVRRSDAAGCEALVVTTNSQIFGRREWDSRTRIGKTLPTISTLADAALHPRWAASALSHGMPDFANVVDFIPRDKRGFFAGAFWIRGQMRKTLGWSDIAAIRDRWRKPLFVKGLIHPDEVRAARDSGVDGVILGTHGGRQADWSASALDVLAEARAILGDGKALYLSGGIRRGSDIIKAMALGADAVVSGRAMLHGLCAYGRKGVERAIAILSDELSNELGQLGVASLRELGRDALVHRRDLPLRR
jgi:(S)-mandelate dehydrogenase